jgi:GABA(A) receptor-associated protein
MYKLERTLDDRIRESRAMLTKYSDRIPIIIHPKSTQDPKIDKHKYMAPRNLTFSQLFYVIRKRLHMDSSKGIFFFLENNTLVIASSVIEEVYSRYADEDGFLYICYSIENTFG